jgi:hypothetical protein
LQRPALVGARFVIICYHRLDDPQRISPFVIDTSTGWTIRR